MDRTADRCSGNTGWRTVSTSDEPDWPAGNAAAQSRTHNTGACACEDELAPHFYREPITNVIWTRTTRGTRPTRTEDAAVVAGRAGGSAEGVEDARVDLRGPLCRDHLC